MSGWCGQMLLATVHLLLGAGKCGFWKLLGFKDIIISKIRRNQEEIKKQHSEIHTVQCLGPGGRMGAPLVMKIWAEILLTWLLMLLPKATSQESSPQGLHQDLGSQAQQQRSRVSLGVYYSNFQKDCDYMLQ